MDMQAIKDEIVLKLTGDVTSLELSDSSLTKIVNSAMREIQRYIDTIKFITIPYSKCIDMKPYKVNAVVKVMRTVGYLNNDAMGDDSMTMDPLYASQWQLLTGTGNVANMESYVYNLASWNTIMQIRNTTSTDLSHIYSKTDEKLYINVSTNIPNEITIMYIPRFDDVSQITSDFWIDVLVRMSVAIAKTTVGRVRSKFKQTNALWTMDGDALIEEGNTELTNLRQELKDSTQLSYLYD
jgi:hypothetical protein